VQVQEPGEVAACLRAEGASVLVDDLGLWVTRVLDDAGAWEGPLPAAVDEALTELERAWRDRQGRAVLVAPRSARGWSRPRRPGGASATCWAP
jgi:adenosylcobinamide kinase/adenosylcobinamide-phosphate guanylyltransferase